MSLVRKGRAIELLDRFWQYLVVKDLISISSEIQSGEPVFAGTRVPVRNLFDYLKGGDTIDEFLNDFPSVRRDQVERLLNLAEHTFTFSETVLNEEITPR
jgi:uncharacterized protein (DUF433 family)